MKNLLFIFALVVLLVFGTTSTFAQITLISPTDDGGLETGATFAANGWTEVNGDNNNWYVGSAPVVYAGTNCAFSGTNSTTWTGEAFANVNHFYRDVTFPSGDQSNALTFYYKVVGPDATWDMLKVYLVPTTTTPVAGTVLTTGQIGSTYDAATAWTLVTINIMGVTPGSTQRLVFSWRTDGATPHAAVAVDNISLVSTPLYPLIGGTTYPINGTEAPPTSFASITSALSYLSANGVSGSGQVILELSTGYAGTEAAPVTIGPISGTSASLGVTFRPALGYTATTSVVGLASPNQFAIALNGCQYVTLDGQAGGTGGNRDWTIICTGTSLGQSAIRFLNDLGSTSNNTIRYCNLQAEATGTTAAIVAMTVGTTGMLYQNNIIEYNLIESGAAGIRGYAVSYGYAASGVLHTGNILRHNIIRRFSDNGVRITGTVPGLLVHNNDIYFTAAQATSTALTGIYFSSTTSNFSGGVKIYNNKIYDLLTSTASVTVRGFYQFSGTFTGDPVQFYNNFIALGRDLPTSTVIYGIDINTSATGTPTYIYYNSVYISGEVTTGAINSMAFRRNVADLACDVRNNVFFNARSNSGGTGVHWAIGLNSAVVGLLNYNDYYVSGTGGVLGTTTNAAAGNQATLAAWKAAVPTDANSISQDPNYTNPTASPPDLLINTAINTDLESGAVPIVGITTDIQGDVRLGAFKVNERPDIGADEFNGTRVTTITNFSGPYDIGTGTYLTLKSFFDAINNGVVTGAITATIKTNITETASARLDQVVYGAGGPFPIRIINDPAKVAILVDGNFAGVLVDLDGADYVTFDGQGKNLTFRNTNVGGQVFRFINGAGNDSIMSCIIEGANSASTSGAIVFGTSTGTIGNSNIVITGNDIRDLSTTAVRPYNAIYALGTTSALNASNTISDNNIFNFQYYGVNVGATGNGGNWIISGNSFYYNNSTVPANAQTSINFNPGLAANSNLIYGNFIGGQAPLCGGAAWTHNAAGQYAGIIASVGSSTSSTIRKNTVKNISCTNTGSYLVAGIGVLGGRAVVDSNTVGDPALAARMLPSGNNVSQTNYFAPKGIIRYTDKGSPYEVPPLEHMAVSDALTVDTKSTTSVIADKVANSISVAGSSSTNGIINQSSFPVTIANNEVSNLTATGTGTGVTCRGIYVATTAAACETYINSNIVHDLTSSSTSTSQAGTAAVIGIVHWPGGYNLNPGQIYKNTIYTLKAINTGAVATSAMGIMFTNAEISVHNNEIRDIQNLSTGTTVTAPPTVSGIVVRATSGPAIYNNMISLGDAQTTNTSFHGVWNPFGTVNYYGLYYNSVLITGTASAGALPSFGFLRGNYTGTAITTTTDAKNNIFSNIRSSGGTGKNYAIGHQVSTTDAGWLFNYNVLYSANPATLGLWGATDLDFSGWRAAQPGGSGGDANSVSGDPAFTNPTNLLPDAENPNSWVVNGKGTQISSVTNDFTGAARCATVACGPTDIGAYEFTPTVLPPLATPSGSPSNNVTTTYTLAGNTLGSIAWGAGGTVPTSLDFQYYSGTQPTGLNQGNNGKCYWTLTGSGGDGFTYNLTLTYTPAEIGNIIPTNLIIAKRDGSIWVPLMESMVNTSNNTVTIEGLDSFSDFILTDRIDPLPIQLVSFVAQINPIGSGVLLEWTTMSETNNYGFYVERRNDNELEFTEVPNSFIPGAGTTLEPQYYSFIDNTLTEIGLYHYRLRQVDNDGLTHYSHSVSVNVSTLSVRELAPNEFRVHQNYPNPFNPTTTIKFSVDKIERAAVVVYNVLGQEVAKLFDGIAEPGYYYKVQLNGSNLSSGLYFYRVVTGSNNEIKKMILLK